MARMFFKWLVKWTRDLQVTQRDTFDMRHIMGHIRELPLRRLALDRPAPNSTGLLFSGASSSQEMEEEEHYGHDEDNVNESAGNVKCEKPK
jgi:hypothetical protein